MRRRELVLLLGGAMTAARVSRAQQRAMPVIGFLSVRSPGEAAGVLAAFHQGLRETGCASATHRRRGGSGSALASTWVT
jgi:putative ABC transport system substrate-binding protein